MPKYVRDRKYGTVKVLLMTSFDGAVTLAWISRSASEVTSLRLTEIATDALPLASSAT